MDIVNLEYDHNNATPSDYVLPTSIPVLFDADKAKKMLEEIRWRHGRNCARCSSPYTKELNSSVFRDMYRCIDCTYMFNALSGTIFQGTKLPLSKMLQMFVIIDSMGPDANSRDLVFALDVTVKTASALKEKAAKIPHRVNYTMRDRAVSQALRQEAMQALEIPENDRFALYCDANGILINRDGFFNRIAEIASRRIVGHK